MEVDTLNERWITSLSHRQQKVLALISIPPALLSIVSSFVIIYLVVKSRFDSTYRRILFGFSIIDVYASITYIISPLLLPRETSSRVWALGNQVACSFAGASLQFSFGNFWYYGSMSFYFLLVIKYGFSRQRLIRAEIIMHVLSIGYPLITSIIGGILGVYSEYELGRGCWVANYKCQPNGITCQSNIIGWVFGGAPICFMFLATLANNLIIYIHVKRTIFRFAKRTSSSSGGGKLSLQPGEKLMKQLSSETFLVTNQVPRDYPEIFTPQIAEKLPSHCKHHPEQSVSLTVQLQSEGEGARIPDPKVNAREDGPSLHQKNPTTHKNTQRRVSFTAPASPPNDDQVNESASVAHSIKQTHKNLVSLDLRSMLHRGLSSNSSSELNISHRSLFQEPNMKRVRDVATQAFLYVAAFFVTYFVPVLLRILESFGFRPADEDKVYTLLVISHISLPLIGFFNLLIYIRPRYLRTRSEFPNQWRTWAIRRALYGEAVQPSPSEIENSNFVHSNSLVVSQTENSSHDNILLDGQQECKPDPRIHIKSEDV